MSGSLGEDKFRFSGKGPSPEQGEIRVMRPEEGWVCEVEPANETQGPLIRSSMAAKGLAGATYEGCINLLEIFERSVELYPDNPCLGKRLKGEDGTVSEYKWMTYREVGEKVKLLGSGLAAEGIASQDKIGVFGANCPEWMIAMQACNRNNVACVPLYDTLGENAVEYILNHAECKAVFVSSEKLGNLLKSKGNMPTVKLVVYWGEASDEDKAALKSAKVKSYSFPELLDAGAKSPSAPVKAKTSDIATIMYTSGTTGNPKGVILPQSALVSELNAVGAKLKAVNCEVTENEVFFSYLPLAHIFDRMTEELVIAKGGCIGYWQGNVKAILDDVGSLKPTFFCGVPRIFDRIYSAVMAKMSSSFVAGMLYRFAMSRKFGAMKKGASVFDAAPLMDKIIFSKIKARLGGNVRIMISGGAPLAPHVEKFLRVAMCCAVVQGYGLTETCAASFVAVPDDMSMFATIGVPFPSVEYRLEAVPEMNYSPFSDPPSGEVLIRGPSVFSGYYKDEAQTKGAIDKDGFFHTGDIGEIQPSGALKIVDRKKNIFKLSQGEYVAVEVVESVYKKNLNMEQVWVYGNSFENCLVAIVVPNEEKIMAWAKDKGVAGDYATVCKTPEANEMILGELKKTGKESKLKGFEIVKAVHLDYEQFSIETDLLTPSFKLKRPQLLKHYKSKIDALYASLK
ncbi:acetyl-CoA synthetase-like protein [Chloropicon primus]|uniref:Long-chain-fatty-acid--CoA ligase n=1 Tax=Chloropicon primus TaxID=1764295 RepID=A0A5B8MT28_9CHLO|nr:acetyl-CoA synthetase-like protein [Chloropicon primus]|mmetsp:Transcript_3876/g.11194  ORF Transcript_3876/g.11194 Transcript_3876/m.11194 type:complete len:681 (+) Transcript_3876:67-2109(+)|eukprot:QDZ23683.1 acetyl-CoA synthetase-like protein [Chloropicon primus]